MQTGRPSKRKRPPFGQRIYEARLAIGLSQAEVAYKLGIKQPGYAAWERDAVALKPDQLADLAKVLQVTTDYLLGNSQPKKHGGPTGKLRQLFEEASKLPRNKQRRIAEMVNDVLVAHKNGA